MLIIFKMGLGVPMVRVFLGIFVSRLHLEVKEHRKTGTSVAWRNESFRALSSCQVQTNSVLLGVLCHSQDPHYQSLVGITSDYTLSFLLPITPSPAFGTLCNW